MGVKKIIREIINEVRYLDPKYYNLPKEKPIRDDEVIRVYHGFYSFEKAIEVITKGLSGKDRANRIYSYEYGNNPKGLFVSVDFDIVKKEFASSGVIIEFSSKVSDLEAPVWVGGRSYFVQGEYTQSFRDEKEREEQRLKNREREKQSEYPAISKSDRPELAQTLLHNYERQALFIGDLNPNMIKYVWYNKVRHVQNRIDGDWIRYKRVDFLRLLKIKPNKKDVYNLFKPADDFSMEKIIDSVKSDYYNLKDYIRWVLLDTSEYDLREYGFYPKQINQIMKLRDDGYFEKYLK